LRFSPPGSEGLVYYYRAVGAAAGECPVLAYHFPTMSAPGTPIEVLSELPVAGLKHSSADPHRLITEVSGWDGRVFVGSTRTLELARSLGATGAILGIANGEPDLCVAA
jgi:4-hydroxy-tetrahydrodipicolinate synthase